MIPLRLHIKNFLSYGAPVQTINFEPYHLICLSGKNGHGKSALLDAITWSLWGHARKAINVHKADDALLRLGQTHMMVALDFTCNDEIYRVRREYSLKGMKGTVSLDVGIKNRTTGTLQQLTEKTVRDTQAIINRIIGLDHEAFENSAFLRQGQSDAFSRQTPQDRKETLSNILGIGLYEVLRKQVAEKNKIEQSIHKQILYTCSMLAQDAERHTTYATELTELRARVDQLNQTIEKTQKQYTDSMDTIKAVRIHYDTLATPLAKLHHCKAHITHTRTILMQTRSLWRALHQQLIQSSMHHTGLRTREEIVTALAHLNALSEQRLTITQMITQNRERAQTHLHELQRTADQHESLLRQTINQQETKAEAIKQRLQEIDQESQILHNQQDEIRNQIGTLDAALQQHEPLVATVMRHEEHIEQYRTSLQRCITHHHRIDHEKVTTEQMLNALTHDAASHCTLCLQPLSATEREQITISHTKQIQRLIHQIERIERYIKAYQLLLSTLHQELHIKRQEVETLRNKQQEKQRALEQQNYIRHAIESKNSLAATLAADLSRIATEIEKSTRTLEEHHRTTTARYQEDTRLQALHATISEHERALQQLPQPVWSHQQLQEELSRINAVEAQRIERQEQTIKKSELAKRIHELCTELRIAQQEVRTLAPVETTLITLQNTLRDHEDMTLQLRTQLDGLMHDKERIIQKIGALEQATHHSAQQAVALNNERKKLIQTEENINDYTILAHALSKDGIQGMLIEHILPDLEQEANRLLSKLTDNQAHLRFESVKELKSGGAKETLDIKISDALGVRPYEFFSGGEAFRIDFALRLAIAKLLARRAGASLQTLIIDEGFGSQDEEGLHNIMESLYAIQHEFAKIIIVSHLPSMKDQFPVHFHIHKSAQGSKVQIIEHQ